MAFNDQGGAGGFQRPMFKGNWSCAKCGGAITELPFDPDPSRLGQLKCRECHRAERGDRPRGSFGGGRGGFNR